MVFWKKKQSTSKSTSPSTPNRGGKRKFQPLEVKMMAVEAKVAGLTSREVAEIVGVNQVTVDKWFRNWKEKGPEAFAYHYYSPTVRGISKP